MREIFLFDAYSDYIFADYYEKYIFYDQNYDENDYIPKIISLQEFRDANKIKVPTTIIDAQGLKQVKFEET